MASRLADLSQASVARQISSLPGRGGPEQKKKKCIPHSTILPSMETQQVGQPAPRGSNELPAITLVGGSSLADSLK